MVTSASRERNLRPLLLALALLFAGATVVYSGAWMYYQRVVLPVEVGIDTNPSPGGIIVQRVWKNSPAEESGLRVHDVITAINGRSISSPAACGQILDQVWIASHPGDICATSPFSAPARRSRCN